MRHFIILLLSLPLYCTAQHAVISATKMNVLYAGIENPVSFAVENEKCSDLTLAVKYGIATKIRECEYKVVIAKTGMTTISIIKGNDTVLKSPFRVKNIPDPIARFGSYDGPKWFSLDSLRKQNSLYIVMKDFDFDAVFTILNFEFTVLRKKKLGGDKKIYCDECLKKIESDQIETIFHGINDGAEFNDSLKEFVQEKLMAGDRVYIEEIKARDPAGRIRSLNPISFRVQ